MKIEEKVKTINDIRTGIGDNSFGNQIRTYTLDPYVQIKDHKTQLKISKVENILNGNLTEIINNNLDFYLFHYTDNY